MNQDSVLEPAEILERFLEEPPIKRRLTWLKETLQEAEKHAAPFGESKRPQRFTSYVALISNISDIEPSLFDEANKLQV
jgi:hypothetical protein